MMKNNSFLFSYDCVHQLCIKWTDAMLITTNGLSLSIFYFGKSKNITTQQKISHTYCAHHSTTKVFDPPLILINVRRRADQQWQF